MARIRIVIVGASVGGIRTAQALRSLGFDGELVLFDAERSPLYDKPPLSKKYLNGTASDREMDLLSAEELAALDATTDFGVSAAGLDPVGHTLALADGRVVAYDTLVIATGARARRIPWAHGPGVHVLRTREDADKLAEDLRPGRHLAVVGAGFIGAETAATARAAGMRVTLIDPLGYPMSRALHSEAGEFFTAKYQAEGVETRFGIGVNALDRDEDGLILSLTDGSKLRADSLLLGIGAVVNTEWLEGSGLTLENGVVCDASLTAIGASNIHVVGDVARFTSREGVGTHRLEHWTSAVDQAKLVAHNIVNPGEPKDYSPVEYVWSDQYDWKIQIIGRTGFEDAHLIGDPERGRFALLYGRDDAALEGAVVVNWPRALIDARRSVAARAPLADLRARLVDDETASASLPR